MLSNKLSQRRNSKWIVLAAAATVPLRAVRAADVTWSGAGGDGKWTTAANWIGSVAPVSGDRLVFAGTAGLSNINSFPNDTSFGGLIFAPSAGAFVLGGNRIVLGGDVADNHVSIQQRITLPLLLSGPGGSRNIDVVDTGVVTFIGAISGNLVLSKSGCGTALLTAENIFTGATAIKAGTLALDFSAVGSTGSVLYSHVPRASLLLGDGASPPGARNQATFQIISAGTAHTQSFASTNIGVGKSVVRVDGPAGPITLNLGPLTHDLGGSVMFMQSGGPITANGTPSDHGMIGPWALWVASSTLTPPQPTGFAAFDGGGNVIPYNGYTTYTTPDDTANVMLSSTAFHDKNVRLVGSSHAPISVQVDTAGAASTTDLNTVALLGASTHGETLYIGAGNTLRLGQYGAIFRQDTGTDFNSYVGGIADAVQSASGTVGTQDVGTLTAGGAPDTAGELHLITTGTSNRFGRMIVEAKITDNGSGAVTLIKTGAEGVKLDGHNTYSGGTYIHEGLIQLAGNEVGTINGDGLGTGPVYIMPGGQVFIGPTATVANNFFVAGVGTRDENFGAIRGPLGSVGAATLTGTITLVGDARLTASGGDGSAAGLRLQGRITDDGNRRSATFGDGGGIGGAGSGSVTLANPVPDNNDWTGDAFIGYGDVFLGASEQIPHGPGKGNLIFNATNGGTSATFRLNGNDETINGLTQASGSGSGYFILNNKSNSTSTLTLGAADATASFAGQISSSGNQVLNLVKIGAGTQTLGGTLSYNGTTIVGGGKLVITKSYTNGTSVEIADGASLDLPHSATTPNNVVLKTAALSIHPAGRLDLADNKLVVVGGEVAAQTALIASGRNGGGWTGSGIVTSQTAATSGNFTSVGIATASQVKAIDATQTSVWAGQTVTGSDALIMYTYGGDANLDGKINVDDYGRIDSNLPLGVSGWYNGDFNYDGKINVDDYGIIDFNIGIQGAPFPTAGGSVGGVTAVPEPVSPVATLAVAGATTCLRRRRRRSRSARSPLDQIKQS